MPTMMYHVVSLSSSVELSPSPLEPRSSKEAVGGGLVDWTGTKKSYVIPLADTGPSQSLLHVAWRHGSVVGIADGTREGLVEGRTDG